MRAKQIIQTEIGGKVMQTVLLFSEQPGDTSRTIERLKKLGYQETDATSWRYAYPRYDVKKFRRPFKTIMPKY